MRLPGTDIAGGWLGHPSKRAFGPDGVLDPLGDGLGQAEYSRTRILFRHDKIAPRQQPIEIIQGPSTSIHADNGARPFRCIQFQGRLCCLHQRRPRLNQLDIAGKETINDHLLRACGQRVLHLPDILIRTRIQCLLHHRLLRTPLASKGVLQGRIGSQARIDFYHPVGSSQQADKGIIELVRWCMFDGLLPNLYLGTDRTKQIKLTQLHSPSAAKLAAGLKCFVVGVIDSFMVMLLLMKSFFGSSLAMEHRHAFGKLFKSWQTCRYFGRNLGSLNVKLLTNQKFYPSGFFC
jgi:hypothetical protein